MRKTFALEFTERRLHVSHYLRNVITIEHATPLGSGHSREISRLKVLRAGTFLVLYNLIEATTRSSITAIHDEIKSKGITFENLNDELREEVIRIFHSSVDTDDLKGCSNFSMSFVSVALDVGVKLSGNVDARKLKKLSRTYGFSHESNRSITRDGEDLLTIKTNRNDLAHGLKTFEEVGEGNTASDLISLYRRSALYMGSIVSNIEKYIDEAAYLKKP